MDWISTIWAAANSPIGITVVAAIAAAVLGRVYKARPLWKAFEGTIIAAVKYAEREIPDTAEDTGTERLNMALQYVLRVYEKANRKRASPKVTLALQEAIGVKHAELEASGALSKGKAVSGRPKTVTVKHGSI